MTKYSFNEIKSMIENLTSNGLEPELTLHLHEKEYMIIGYGNHVSFQRCGYLNGSGEVNYTNLEELYNTETVDNILLCRDWCEIESFDCPDFEFHYNKDF